MSRRRGQNRPDPAMREALALVAVALICGTGVLLNVIWRTLLAGGF